MNAKKLRPIGSQLLLELADRKALTVNGVRLPLSAGEWMAQQARN
jgi:co-chaperonin GroES (HSP10)